MSWHYGFRPYVPVAKRRAKAAAYAAKLAKKEKRSLAPIKLEGRKIAGSFWGKAWCDNLESYSDFANRLPRGRTYVRNGSVIDLQIERGKVKAIVSGSEIYRVAIDIKTLSGALWTRIKQDCARSIDSLIELLQARFDQGIMERLTRQDGGLFPRPKEIEMDCSCPDWAGMCKHVAAVLYGVGARLDTAPDLLFTLRDVDHLELIGQAVTAENLDQAFQSKASAPLAGADLGAVFGIDLDVRETKAETGAVTTAGAPGVASESGAIPRHRKTKTMALPANVKQALAAEPRAARSAAKSRRAKQPGKRKLKASVGS